MLQPHPQGTLLAVRASPGSRKQGVTGVHGSRLKVAVHAAPEKGKANQAILEVLAEAFKLKRSQVVLKSGETSQAKSVLLIGITPEQVQAMLTAAGG